jgi:hypothetical protein
MICRNYSGFTVLVATLSIFREAWDFGIAAQLKTHASGKLPLAARTKRGFQLNTD